MKGSVASKQGSVPISPAIKIANQTATSKGTGLEGKQPARALNEDSMARLLSSGNPKMNITQPKDN